MSEHPHCSQWRHRELRGPACAEAVYRIDMVSDIAVAEVKNRSPKTLNLSSDNNLVVRVRTANMAVLAPKQAYRPIAINCDDVIMAQMEQQTQQPMTIDRLWRGSVGMRFSEEYVQWLRDIFDLW